MRETALATGGQAIHQDSIEHMEITEILPSLLVEDAVETLLPPYDHLHSMYLDGTFRDRENVVLFATVKRSRRQCLRPADERIRPLILEAVQTYEISASASTIQIRSLNNALPRTTITPAVYAILQEEFLVVADFGYRPCPRLDLLALRRALEQQHRVLRWEACSKGVLERAREQRRARSTGKAPGGSVVVEDQEFPLSAKQKGVSDTTTPLSALRALFHQYRLHGLKQEFQGKRKTITEFLERKRLHATLPEQVAESDALEEKHRAILADKDTILGANELLRLHWLVETLGDFIKALDKKERTKGQAPALTLPVNGSTDQLAVQGGGGEKNVSISGSSSSTSDEFDISTLDDLMSAIRSLDEARTLAQQVEWEARGHALDLSCGGHPRFRYTSAGREEGGLFLHRSLMSVLESSDQIPALIKAAETVRARLGALTADLPLEDGSTANVDSGDGHISSVSSVDAPGEPTKEGRRRKSEMEKTGTAERNLQEARNWLTQQIQELRQELRTRRKGCQEEGANVARWNWKAVTKWGDQCFRTLERLDRAEQIEATQMQALARDVGKGSLRGRRGGPSTRGAVSIASALPFL